MCFTFPLSDRRPLHRLVPCLAYAHFLCSPPRPTLASSPFLDSRFPSSHSSTDPCMRLALPPSPPCITRLPYDHVD
ncbi:hypothetical protein BD310DRAFT_360597 [Dichomitus squalens]|uniref:Uncharacterized protein n=1 Tax=Dichomitus squalens TaxID=114155 RepID=A0A4Q9PG30_9APHY|nr:hypothetical protein BD310DRAFT_360597 [Dichomitus squalens]